jgi:hypothetical protein
MAELSTERLEPASRIAEIERQPRREQERRPRRRPPEPAPQQPSEPAEESSPSHQVDSLA